MEEASGTRHIDVSMLISDRKEEYLKSDTFGVHAVLQSDRGQWQLSHWIIFTLTALCCSWQTLSPAFLVLVSDCVSIAPDLRYESPTEDRTNRTSHSHEINNIHEMNSCFIQFMTSDCSMQNYRATSVVDRATPKCLLAEDDEYSNISHESVAFYGTKYLIAAAKSVYMFGSFSAIVLVPFVVNRFGQRCVALCGFLLFYLCSVASSFTTSMAIYLTLRYFLSLSTMSMYWVTLQAMLESVVSDYRLLYGIIGYLGWAVGYMILPVIAYGTTDWFAFQISVSVPCLLLAVPLWYFPESVNYLLRRGKIREAVDVVKTALKKNGRNADDISEICHQSHRSLMKRSLESEENMFITLKTHLGYRNLLYYASSFMTSFLYYVISWNFNVLPGDPFASFAWAGAMETLAVLLLIFFGYFAAQSLLFFIMAVAVGASAFLVLGILIATGDTEFPVHSYMAIKFFVSGAVILIPIRAFEESSFIVTAAVTSIGAAVAPLLDQMISNYFGSTMMMIAASIAYSVLGVLSALFPLRSAKGSVPNPLTSNFRS